MAKDANFKEYLGKLLVDTGVKAVNSLKVGELPLEIDIFLTVDEGTDLSYFRPLQTVIDHCGSSRLIIEYKSHNDLLNPKHLYKVLGYRALYLSRNYGKVDPSEVSIVVITTQKPRKILSTFSHTKFSNGIYLLRFEFPIYVISINHLHIGRENYGLLFFSSGRTLKDFMRFVVSTEEETTFDQMFKSYAVVFHYEEYKMVKSANETPQLAKNIQGAVKFLGIKNVIDAVGMEEVIDAVGMEEVIDAVGMKEVIDTIGIQNVIDTIGVQNVIDTVGMEEIIGAIGVKNFVDALSDDDIHELRRYLDKREQRASQ